MYKRAKRAAAPQLPEPAQALRPDVLIVAGGGGDMEV
jgi:hypothetical protein